MGVGNGGREGVCSSRLPLHRSQSTRREAEAEAEHVGAQSDHAGQRRSRSAIPLPRSSRRSTDPVWSHARSALQVGPCTCWGHADRTEDDLTGL